MGKWPNKEISQQGDRVTKRSTKKHRLPFLCALVFHWLFSFQTFEPLNFTFVYGLYNFLSFFDTRRHGGSGFWNGAKASSIVLEKSEKSLYFVYLTRPAQDWISNTFTFIIKWGTTGFPIGPYFICRHYIFAVISSLMFSLPQISNTIKTRFPNEKNKQNSGRLIVQR